MTILTMMCNILYKQQYKVEWWYASTRAVDTTRRYGLGYVSLLQTKHVVVLCCLSTLCKFVTSRCCWNMNAPYVVCFDPT